MKPSEANHIKVNDGPPSAMTANFLCSVANDMPLNEREARLLAAKFEATPCYAEYSALCAVAELQGKWETAAQAALVNDCEKIRRELWLAQKELAKLRS